MAQIRDIGKHYEMADIVKDVDKIFNSGNTQIISTMKLNIKAYLYCIENNQRPRQKKKMLPFEKHSGGVL